MKVEGKGAFVSGGANGIGKATTKLLLEKGAKVCIVDINSEAGEGAINEFRKKHGQDSVYFCQCDVTYADDLKRAFVKSTELLGRLDIVFNNAGFVGEDKWEKTIDVNLTSVVRATKLAFEMLRKDTGNEGGVVVNTASVAGLIPFSIISVYTATKHGVVGLTRAFATRDDAAETQVRFNCVCPGFVKTGFTDPRAVARENWGDDYERWVETLEGVEPVMISVDAVAEGVLELIENEDHQGSVMHISFEGRELVPVPDLMVKY